MQGTCHGCNVLHCLVRLTRRGIAPHIITANPLEDAAQAHRTLESRGMIGKVLLTPQRHQ